MKYPSLLVAGTILCVAFGTLSGCEKHATKADQQAVAHASFATPDEADAALIAAVERGDTGALLNLLGPGAAPLLSSGDPVADRRERESFVGRYRAYHELVAGSPDELVLLVGTDRWPLPIPLTRTANRWSFDGAAGVRELLLRRIGANELHTIDVMRGFVAAQRDYASTGHDGDPPGAYAQKLRSTPGTEDGLYWEVAAGEPQSPAGPLLANASAEGYGAGHGARAPYHGYLYKVLTSQGPAADGGATNYLVDGKQTGGFAVLAYPVAYGVTGIMTFIVNQDGVVWQKDLGKETTQAATSIQQFDPDDSWTPIAPEG